MLLRLYGHHNASNCLLSLLSAASPQTLSLLQDPFFAEVTGFGYFDNIAVGGELPSCHEPSERLLEKATISQHPDKNACAQETL